MVSEHSTSNRSASDRGVGPGAPWPGGVAEPLAELRAAGRGRLSTLAAGVTALGMLVASACGDDVTPGQSSGSGADSGTPSATTTTGMMIDCGDLAETTLEGNCAVCVNTACCVELAACESAACRDRFACERACSGDSACIAMCETMHPGGDEAAAVSACVSSSCDVCAPPSAICGTELSLGAPACDACISESCCVEIDACLADADCKLCIESGEPSSCDMSTIYDDAVACIDGQCATACGG